MILVYIAAFLIMTLIMTPFVILGTLAKLIFEGFKAGMDAVEGLVEEKEE